LRSRGRVAAGGALARRLSCLLQSFDFSFASDFSIV
jgi:hypothetical protein